MTHSEKRLGLMFTLVGPGGVGKNALINNLLQSNTLENLRQLPTAATRPMRPTEQQGREHQFVTHEEFQHLIDTGALVEWQEVHQGNFYGVPRATIESAINTEQDLIADIDVYGATILRNSYPDNVVLIFIAPPSLEVLETRMRDRGENEINIRHRVDRAQLEMTYAPTCDYLVINDDIAIAEDRLRAIILSERSQRDLLNLRVESCLPRHRADYAARVFVIHDKNVLYHKAAPHFPTSRLMPGEIPHETVLRLLETELHCAVTTDQIMGCPYSGRSFISPLTVTTTQEAFFRQILFCYVYKPGKPIVPPDGWRWIPQAEAGLPQAVTDALSTSS